MTYEFLLQTIDECCNDITFIFNNKNCGVFPEGDKGVKTYHVWYGDDHVDLHTAKDVMDMKIFDGLSIREIMEYTEIRFW